MCIYVVGAAGRENTMYFTALNSIIDIAVSFMGRGGCG